MGKVAQRSEVVAQFTDFFIIFTHQVLYHLALYSPEKFINAKAYRCKILKCGHDGVRDYVVSNVDAIYEGLMHAKVETLGLMLFDSSRNEIERFTIDVTSFSDKLIAWKESSSQTSELDESNGDVLPLGDLNQQLRGSLIRLRNALEKPDCKPGVRQWLPFIIPGGAECQHEVGSTWARLVNTGNERSTAQNTTIKSISVVEAGIITFEIFHETLGENGITSSQVSITPYAHDNMDVHTTPP